MAAQNLGFTIEIAPARGTGLSEEGLTERVINATEDSLKAVAQVAEKCAAVFVAEVSRFSAKPSEVAMEFGIDASAEGGLPMVTKATVGANFKVSLKWEIK